jgi:hypothetical protein
MFENQRACGIPSMQLFSRNGNTFMVDQTVLAGIGFKYGGMVQSGMGKNQRAFSIPSTQLFFQGTSRCYLG